MLNEDRVSLGEVIAAVCDSCREEAEKKGVVLQAPPASELPVWGDQIRLQQILQNLVTNAIHYTPAGGSGGRCCSGERPGHGLRHCAGGSGRRI